MAKSIMYYSISKFWILYIVTQVGYFIKESVNSMFVLIGYERFHGFSLNTSQTYFPFLGWR